MQAAIIAFVCFGTGACLGVVALRAWQKSKMYVTSPTMTLLQARYEMLKHAKRPSSVVMLGDSIIAGVPWSEVSDCPGVANFGFNGDTSEGVLYRLDEILLLRPKAIFLMVGANDVLKGIPPQKTAANILSIVEQLERNGSTLFVHPVLPIKDLEEQVSLTNKAILEGLKRAKATIVPLPIELDDLRDGLHMGPSGFIKWHNVIRPLMASHSEAQLALAHPSFR